MEVQNFIALVKKSILNVVLFFSKSGFPQKSTHNLSSTLRFNSQLFYRLYGLDIIRVSGNDH